MSFQQALSGLNASSRALDVTSNNVANASTVGFKTGSTHFADVYANSLSGAGSSSIGIGTSIQAIQQNFTTGNITSTNNPLDIAINGGGFFRMSTNGVISYSRNGQFHLDSSGYIVDDKNRQLTGYPADATGKVVQSSPVALQLDAADQTPVATGAGSGSFKGVKAVVNLDSRKAATTWVSGSALTAGSTSSPNTWSPDPANYNWTTALSTYDSLGNAHTLSLYAVKTGAKVTATTAAAASLKTAADAAAASYSAANATAAQNAANSLVAAAQAADTAGSTALTQQALADALVAQTDANAIVDAGTAATAAASAQTALTSATAASDATKGQWEIHATVDGTSDTGVTLTNSTLQFTTSGKLDTTIANNGVLDVSIDLAGITSALGKTNSATTPLTFQIDFTGSSQYGSAFGANRLEQDGYTSGRLTGVAVANDGTIRGNYSNGQSRDLGQVALANFTNPNGLAPIGGNQWVETSTSGQATVGAPGTSSLGVLQASAVEESNVDLTAELVNMITQQRNYQANAQSIKTQDSIMQTIVNLR